jgi:hypothetical protein
MSERAVLLRLLASIGALALGALAVVIVARLAHETPGPASSATTPSAPATPSTAQTSTSTLPSPATGAAFPASPPGAVVFSRESGNDVIALGVVPRNRLLLQTSVLSGQGIGVPGLDVSFRVGSKQAAARPCGDGCYRATIASPRTPKVVEVHVSGTKPTPVTWRVQLPKRWPPPDASQIVARATRALRSLRTLTIDDSLSSGLGRTIYTHWTVASPDRLTYRIENGPSAVIIGSSRWDKVPGQNWVKSQQTPIHQVTPFWVSWTDAHVLDETPTAWHVTFFDPKTPGWYELTIAKSSLRPMSMRMEAASHFMTQRYSGFNAPVRIAPPP